MTLKEIDNEVKHFLHLCHVTFDIFVRQLVIYSDAGRQTWITVCSGILSQSPELLPPETSGVKESKNFNLLHGPINSYCFYAVHFKFVNNLYLSLQIRQLQFTSLFTGSSRGTFIQTYGDTVQ